ncbi:hypothetical protein HMH01_13800 [Halovulum dunhuangense]|uniref:Bacterial bifunctional deaminase-reductase C-terminal domain-containing protein n=1 Tax=Halovulum dunhuangense TaxID=1505036 RepID=A0A849L568_9RHOB|nr:dihydrofolate reductase family protein [Halovulum dunhuangense]NNU81509.1 hypothetical protein [Halovulum dunhuangense]
MTRPRFTLLVVASEDGFIARHPADNPAGWASAEEQALFLAAVDAADWSVMGRHTHEAADRPERRRIVFSSRGGGWKRPTQLWLNPEGITPAALPGLVGHVHPMREGLILGGTAVHDWFHRHGAIDEVRLTIEPVRFGTGLAIFSGDGPQDPERAFTSRGHVRSDEEVLNAAGTRLLTLRPSGA